MPKQFEYKIFYLWIDKEDVLNRLGKEGWELVYVDGNECYFKRELNVVQPNIINKEKINE
jgi:hypothetical protein